MRNTRVRAALLAGARDRRVRVQRRGDASPRRHRPSPGHAAPASPPPVAPSRHPGTGAPAPGAGPVEGAALKIGVVTDIGTLNDKNYNEYSYKGAAEGATALGAATPPSIVPKDASEYTADIQ